MRRTPARHLLPLMLLGALLLPALAPTAAAAGDPARLAQVLLMATPGEQAVLGQIEVVAHAYLQGNPHKTLYAEEIVATLVLSGDAEPEIVTGPDPARIALMEVPASVATFPADFTWRIRGTAVGTVTVRVHVTTKDSGNQWSETVTVVIEEGLGVAPPRRSEKSISDRDPLRAVVNITNPFTVFPLLEVRLCASLFPGDPPAIEATLRDGLRIAGGTVVPGTCVPMLPVEPASVNWTGTIPAQKRTGKLVVWVWAATENAATAGSPTTIRVYSAEGLGAGVLVSSAVAGAGILLLVIGLYWPYLRGRR